MTTVTGTIQQQSCYEQYSTGNCSCFHCSAWSSYPPCNPDWQCGSVGGCCVSCPSPPLCSKVNPSVCPVIDDAFLSAEWTNPGSDNDGTVTCSYDATKITSINGINTWITTFGQNEEYNNTIMPNFCAIPGDTNCQVDPDTGKPMANCSRLTATDQFGSLCSNWCLLPDNEDLCDGTMTTYCATNDTPDCGCVSRSNNPAYQEVKPELGAGIPDGCWYIPCSGGNLVPYMVPSQVIPTPGLCPQNICTQIENIVSEPGGSATIGQLNQVIDCNFSDTGSGNGGTGSGTENNPGGDSGGGFLSDNKDVVIIVIVIIIIIVIAIIIGAVILF